MGASSKVRLTIGVLALMLLASSCTSGNDTSQRNKGTKSTTTAAKEATAPYAEAGPYKVGFTERKLADGRRVVIWYPTTDAAIEGKDQEQIDIASFLNPTLQAKIPAVDRTLYPADAFKDAKPKVQKGGYPVVLFSHGYAGFPEQSVSLTTHMASWGYVVAAPNHVERSLDGMLGTAAEGVAKSSDQEVLSSTLDLIQEESLSSDSLLSGTVDPERSAVTGHSAGASATYQTALVDPRIDGWIAYSIGLKSDLPDGASATAVPDSPGMVQLGTKDGVIPPASSDAVFESMKSPKYLVQYLGAGHLVFSDICLIGEERGGIINIAKTLQLPIPENLLKLGTDGCGPDYPAVDKAFPAMNQTSVSFLRWVFGQDEDPVGLTTEAVADLGAEVTVTKG
ncbi:MAG TPA: dienelactone hydrolase family protein [Microthrixaceae bacterium]|nr:dienelactone hydrolase family protein [Microthrixaceae bacterium]